MIRKIIFLVLLLSLSASASASALEHSKVAENSNQQQLQSFLYATNSLSAGFHQKLVDKYGYLLQQSAGTLDMQRPGKFRWDYILPYAQNIISNGEKIWIYDSELEQVNIRPYDQILSSSPVNLLDKKQALELDFEVQSMDDSEAQQWVQLVPKKLDSDFLQLEIGLQNGKIKTMRFKDKFEQTTEIEFENLQVNPRFDSQHFDFQVPKGSDVIGDF